MTSKPKTHSLSLVFPRTTVHGGALGVMAWAIHALQSQYTLHVYTLDECDPDSWNASFGTEIDRTIIQWNSYSSDHPKIAFWLNKRKMFTLDQYVLMKWVDSKIASNSLPFSLHNEMSFSTKGLQYIHFPMLMTGRKDLSRRMGQSGSIQKEMYGWACKMIFNKKKSDFTKNISLCNSRYIEKVFQEYYGHHISTNCLYPPITSSPRLYNLPWGQRENGVIMIGRTVPDKRFEDGLEILKQCRQLGSKLSLHIVSSDGNPEYTKWITEQTENLSWVTWHRKVDRTGLQKLCGRVKYGLHCNHGEHFGMSTAEMMTSQCLVFGHDSGGTKEILLCPEQRYDTISKAVENILKLTKSPELQKFILEKSYAHAASFSSAQFCKTIQEIVSDTMG
ncbi:glycosyltransferase [Kiritimatiellota bacterium B12222]|nr:glycosyltransferase [Kiritimatiellota bacterium B12222]